MCPSPKYYVVAYDTDAQQLSFWYPLRFSKCEVEKKQAISSVASLREDILAKENRLAKVEADLKQLQKKSDLDKETLYKAREETNYWQKVGQVSITYLSMDRQTIYLSMCVCLCILFYLYYQDSFMQY